MFDSDAPAADCRRGVAADVRDQATVVDSGTQSLEAVHTLLDAFDTPHDEGDETPLDRLASSVTPARFRTFRAAVARDPATAVETLSHLFDETIPAGRRLDRFGRVYDPETLRRVGRTAADGSDAFTETDVLALGSLFLAFAEPNRYVRYEYRPFERFFSAYSDFAVESADHVVPVEQYGHLLDGCTTLRDHLDRYVDNASMLDGGNVVWAHERLAEVAGDVETEHAPSSPLTAVTEPPRPPRSDELAGHLEQVGQIVLYGPPGTGKTWTATRFAEWWTSQGDQYRPGTVETVSFHPSFTYEDFVEGLTADVVDGEVTYRIRDGVFKELAREAAAAYDETPEDETPPRYVLVVDTDGDPMLVADAKWKTHGRGRPRNEDVYQISAYEMAESVPGLLVYPDQWFRQRTFVVDGRFPLRAVALPTDADVAGYAEFSEHLEAHLDRAMTQVLDEG